MQHDYHNPGTGYNGTSSHLGDLVVPTSSKREHGKVKGNKREPRSTVVATSDTVVYASREDYESGKVSHVIPRRASRTTARRTTKRAVTVHAAIPEVARFDSRSLDTIARDNGL